MPVNGAGVVPVWVQIAEQSRGAPVSVAHVCAAAVGAVHVDGVGVTVMASPTVRDTVHATNRVARELEEWQLTLGQGPSVDAFTTDGPVLIADLHTDECRARWPVFTGAALAGGARAVFALTMQVGAVRLGVLELYRARPGPLTPAELGDALAFAEAAGSLLLDEVAGSQPDTAELAWQTDDPTAHDAEVHQATGMVMVQLGTGPEVAFARLRAYAYAHDRRLGEVAREVVARRLRLGTDPPAR